MSAISAERSSAAWQALGTSVVLRVTEPGALDEARAIVELELDAIDRACSRFRPDSELSCVNARAGRSVQASPLLIDAVEVALRAAELTDGDVDPTVGRALQLAGYDRDFKLLQQPTGESESVEGITVRLQAGWRAIAIDRASSSLRIPKGIRLDLGATAKAWATDRTAEAVTAMTGCGALVSLGGDIATAGPAPTRGWRIHVTDDHRSEPSAPGQTISIVSGGLATSSTAVRRWSHDGHTRHHIIDPRTGAPAATRWRTVSVAATSCVDANIATTAAIVRADAAPAWLAELGLPARLVDWHENVTTVGEWPIEERPS